MCTINIKYLSKSSRDSNYSIIVLNLLVLFTVCSDSKCTVLYSTMYRDNGIMDNAVSFTAVLEFVFSLSQQTIILYSFLVFMTLTKPAVQ